MLREVKHGWSLEVQGKTPANERIVSRCLFVARGNRRHPMADHRLHQAAPDQASAPSARYGTFSVVIDCSLSHALQPADVQHKRRFTIESLDDDLLELIFARVDGGTSQ